MTSETTIRLAKFAIETKYEDIPQLAIDFAKGLTMKTVAGMVAGSRKPSGQSMAKLIQRRKLPEDVGVIGSNFKTSLWEAAWLHGFFAHASELEDDRFASGRGTGPSWDITVIPPLMSVAESTRLSGKALLEAIMLGLEVHVRTCLFFRPDMEVMMPAGTVGPAAGVARALGLNVSETASAMGLVMSGMAMSIMNFATDAHYLESSLACLHAVIAAEMAKEGRTSNPDIERYLLRYYGKETVHPEEILADLGKKWLFTEIWIKKYPCCFASHRQIDALLDLKKLHKLSYDEVEEIQMHGGLADRELDRPEPKTEGDLQFSYQHLLGVAILYGDVNLPYMTEESIIEPKIREARSKVKVVLHPEWPKYMATAPVRIVVKTKDGREFSRERTYPIGSPNEPLTTEQFWSLYEKFTTGILSKGEISRTRDMLFHIDELSDVQELMNNLTFLGGKHRSNLQT